MNCNNYQDRLSFYVHNELPRDEADEINEHIKTCDSCRIKVKELSTLMDEVSQIEEVEVPRDFHENLKDRAEKELWTSNGRRYPYMRFVKYISAAAVFAFCIFSVTHLSNFTGAKKDKAMTNSAASTVAQNSQKDIYGSAEVTSGTQSNINGYSAKSDGGSSQSTQTIDMSKDAYGNSLSAESRFSNNIPAQADNTDSNTGSPNVSTDTGSTVNQDVNSDNAVSQPAEAKKPEAKKSTVASPTPSVHQQVVSQNVQIKTSNFETAVKIIEDQSAKINAKVTQTDVVADMTTQDSVYSSKRTFSAEKTLPEETVIVEVKKEDEKQFKDFLVQSFGKDNIHYDTIEDSSAYTIKFIIKITG